MFVSVPPEKDVNTLVPYTELVRVSIKLLGSKEFGSMYSLNVKRIEKLSGGRRLGENETRKGCC